MAPVVARGTLPLPSNAQAFGELIRQALPLIAPLDHRLADQLDAAGIGDIQKGHRRPGHRAGTLLTTLAQDVTHTNGHVTEIDIHRTGIEALMTDGAVIGHVVHFVEMPYGNTAPRLFLVQEGLDDEARRKDLVAR